MEAGEERGTNEGGGCHVGSVEATSRRGSEQAGRADEGESTHRPARPSSSACREVESAVTGASRWPSRAHSDQAFLPEVMGSPAKSPLVLVFIVNLTQPKTTWELTNWPADSLWGLSAWLIDIEELGPLWAAPPLGRWAWAPKKAG